MAQGSIVITSVCVDNDAAIKRASAARARAWCHGRHRLLLNHIEAAMESDWSQSTHRAKLQSKISTNTGSPGKSSGRVQSIDSVFKGDSVCDRNVTAVDKTESRVSQ